MNDGISQDLCSLQYARVDDAEALVKMLGVGTMIAKLDLKSACRMVPVHQLDHAILVLAGKMQPFVIRLYHLGYNQLPSYSQLWLTAWHGQYCAMVSST